MANFLWKFIGRIFNGRIISSYRKNHGQVGGMFKGAPLLLLHHTGAHSGKPRVNPVMYLKDDERYLVFASNNGAKNNPDWYYNLKAHPDTQIEVGDDTIDIHAEALTGPERDTLYERQASLYPRFAKYQRGTKRKIPVVALTKRQTF